MLDVLLHAQSSVLAGMRAGVVILDQHARILAFNPAAERIFGATVNRWVGQPIDTHLPLDAATIGKPESAAEFTLSGVAYEAQVLPLLDQQQAAIGQVVILNDLAPHT